MNPLFVTLNNIIESPPDDEEYQVQHRRHTDEQEEDYPGEHIHADQFPERVVDDPEKDVEEHLVVEKNPVKSLFIHFS